MTSNTGTGYTGFQTAIQIVTEGLGNERFRMAVAHKFVQYLGLELSRRIGDKYPSFYGASGCQWTDAIESDFDRAKERGLAFFSRTYPEATATASWYGATLAHRGHEIILEGGGFSMAIAWFSRETHRHDRYGKPIEQWQISFIDAGARCVTGEDSTMLTSGKPTMTHVKTEAAAQRSLRRIVETFCGVEFADV